MFGLERTLGRWQEAGLIDSETVAAIRQYERASKRPVASMVLVGLALLALGLGIMLVVAANWDLIPGEVKLGGHFAALLAAAWTVYRAKESRREWLAEGAIIVLTVLVIAGMALQGQVYQITSPLWQPLALWLALTAPLLLLAGTTWLTGTAFILICLTAALVVAAEGFGVDADTLMIGTGAGLPYLAILAATVANRHEGFVHAVRAVAIGSILALASLMHGLWMVHHSADDAREALEILVLPGSLLLACLLVLRGEAHARLTQIVLVATFAAAALVLLTPHEEAWQWQLVGAVSFTAMWGVIAWAALHVGVRGLFNLAVTAIGLRLFIIYFEVFGTLAATGIGLILAGLLLLAMLAAVRRVMRMTEKSR